MWNGYSYYKKFTHGFTFALIIILAFFLFFNFGSKDIAYAETTSASTEEDKVYKELEDNTNGILNGIDSSELDEYIENEFNLDFFDGLSFKEIVLSVLSGNYFSEYDSLVSGIVGLFKENFLNLLSFFLSLFVLVLLFEIFNNFCTDKYGELKGVIKIVFSLVITLMIVFALKNIASMITETIGKIFNFTKILFPILLSLILLSGAGGTYSVYSSLSVFLLNTGSYLFMYILMPLSVSIMLLSLTGCVFKNKRFSRVNDILKSVFKYIIIAFLGVFGFFASINAVSSGTKDGVTYKLTRFAIKSYIPVLGGYLSDGFDFVHTCSVLVKNSFGICGILVLLFMVIKPILLYLVYMFMFKILSVIVLFTGSEHYSDVFNNVAKSISYFITILVGIFMCLFVFIYLLIMSVSVV